MLRACGRAKRVTVYAYGNRPELWWKPIAESLERAKNLSVRRIPVAAVREIEKLADRNMQLQCTVQEGQVYFSNAGETVQVELEALKVGNSA